MHACSIDVLLVSKILFPVNLPRLFNMRLIEYKQELLLTISMAQVIPLPCNIQNTITSHNIIGVDGGVKAIEYHVDLTLFIASGKL